MKYVFLGLILAACSSAPNQLSDKAKNIEVVTNKPVNCSVVGKVVGTDKMGSKELATNHALNQAADLRATTLYVNQEVPNGNSISVFATAYQCE